jgi:hypothetical protein
MLWGVGVVAVAAAFSIVVLVVRVRTEQAEIAPWKRALMEGTYIRLPRDSGGAAKAAPAPAFEAFHVPPPPAELPALPPPSAPETAAESAADDELRR